MADQIGNSLNGTSAASLPHVLHVIDADHFERFGRMYRQLFLALVDVGVKVSVLTDDAEMVQKAEGSPIGHQFFPTLRGWGVWRLHRYLRQQFNPPPQIVHLWGTGGIGYFSDWTLHAESKLLIHITTVRDLEKLKRRGLHHNERALAGCREFYDQMRDCWPTLTNEISLHPPALLRPERLPEPSPRGNTLGVMCVGRLERGSGINVLIDAMAQLRDKECDFHVALIGDGGAARDYWRRARSLRVQDRLSIVAEPHIWDRTMVGTDVFVAPARQRELSLAPLLAMSLGKVVITSRDQLGEWFVEDETALQFEPGSAVELAYHLSRVAAGMPTIRAMARNAANYVGSQNAVTALADELTRFYTGLIQGAQAVGGTPLGERSA